MAAGEVDLPLVANLSRLGRDVASVDGYLRWLEDQFVELVYAGGTAPQTSTEILMALMKESGFSLDRVHYRQRNTQKIRAFLSDNSDKKVLILDPNCKGTG